MNGVKLTFFHTCSAFNTLILMNKVRLFSFSCNGKYRAVSYTKHTSDTGFGVDYVIQQIFTMTRTAFFIVYVFLVLFPEIGHG